jgi:cytochrome P450
VPIMGSLPFIGLGKAAGIGPPPHVRMAQFAEQYGDVMELQMGRAPWVVLSSPTAVHEAFVLKGGDYSGRPMVPSMRISSGGGQGFAQPRITPELANLRALAFSKLFSAAQVARSQAELEAEAALLAEHLLHLTAKDGAAELRPALRHCVTNFVLRYTFSERVPYATEGAAAAASPQCAELVRVVGEIWLELTATSTTMADLLAQPRVADAAYAKLRGLVRRRDTLLRSLVAQRRAEAARRERAADAPRDMLDALLAARLSEAEVLYTLVDLFVAGINTVSTSLEWLLLLTAKEPLVQARARAAVCGGGGAPYGEALVKEVLRAKPPLLLPRQAVVDTSVGGFSIPAGRVVIANSGGSSPRPSAPSDGCGRSASCVAPRPASSSRTLRGGASAPAPASPTPSSPQPPRCCCAR